MRGQFLLWSGGGGKGSQLLQLPITSTISFLMASNVLSACMIPMLNCHNIFVFVVVREEERRSNKTCPKIQVYIGIGPLQNGHVLLNQGYCRLSSTLWC